GQINRQGTLDFTIAILEQYFDLSADGYLCQTRDLWQVLVTAAARRKYIETVCNDLPGAPHGNTVRGYLNEQLTSDKIRALQRDWNRALATQLPEWLRDHPKEVAIDLHDEPYYGKDDRDNPKCWVCRGEARDGTTRFYRCATAYIMHKDMRFTLAVVFVHPKDGLVKIVKQLLRRMKALKIKVKRYYFDKGFCNISVLRVLLTDPTLSAIIAVPIRGKKKGTRALCRGRGSYRTNYTFRNQELGELTVPLAVVRTFRKRRDGTIQAVWLIYVLLNAKEVPLQQVRKLYRRRFGIESSYRLMEQVRGRTTSPNPALRFLWMGLALLIGNIWIALHWKYLLQRYRGRHRILRKHFILDRMAQFLRRAVEAVYGVISVVDQISP
ncbi:MAG: transposase, partial [Nitrososphaera sp.]